MTDERGRTIHTQSVSKVVHGGQPRCRDYRLCPGLAMRPPCCAAPAARFRGGPKRPAVAGRRFTSMPREWNPPWQTICRRDPRVRNFSKNASHSAAGAAQHGLGSGAEGGRPERPDVVGIPSELGPLGVRGGRCRERPAKRTLPDPRGPSRGGGRTQVGGGPGCVSHQKGGPPGPPSPVAKGGKPLGEGRTGRA